MKAKTRKTMRPVFWVVGIVVVAAAAFFGIQFFTKTGIFKIPGVVYYAEDLKDDELSKLQNVFTEDLVLDKDVRISVAESDTMPDLSEGEFLVDICVPVADFYDVRKDVSEYAEGEYKYIPIDDLDFNVKLLSVDGGYYLDDFDKGGIFRTIKFDSEKYDEEIKPLVEDLFKLEYPTKDSVLTFAQTGVTALSRGMNAKLYQVGDAAYFAEGIRDFLSSHDLTHTSNESSFTDYANSGNICSDKRFINTLLAIGLDIVELTGNHNLDCGATAALETLDTYKEHNISKVGGGSDADDAAIPLEINNKGSNITFLAYNQSTGGATRGNLPGANQYYEENAVAEISAAKERGDFVIVDIQYYECSAYASEYEDPICDYPENVPGDEIGFFRHLIDLGADLVVGTSAHQPQTFELYGNGAIYYGLGNLFFDQAWWPGTTRSLILSHYFYKGKLLQTNVVPTVYDKSLQTRLLDEETSRWFINRLTSIRP